MPILFRVSRRMIQATLLATSAVSCQLPEGAVQPAPSPQEMAARAEGLRAQAEWETVGRAKQDPTSLWYEGEQARTTPPSAPSTPSRQETPDTTVTRRRALTQVWGNAHCWQSPPSSLDFGESESPSIQVVAERTDVPITDDLLVDIITTGTHERSFFDGAVLQAGKRVSSYLLHLDGPGDSRLASRAVTFCFDRPILAVIASTDRLAKTDDLFAAPHTAYPFVLFAQQRGLEDGINPAGLTADRFTIGDDRSTLKIDEFVVGEHADDEVDQLRVLLEETAPVEFDWSANGGWSDFWGEFLAGTSAGSATIRSVRLDHNVVRGGRKGLELHLSCEARRLRNRSLCVEAYFAFPDGHILRSYDDTFRAEDGAVAVSQFVVPEYDSTVFDDLVLFLPYDELHLAGGSWTLHAKCVIYDTGLANARFGKREWSLVGEADWQPFTYSAW